MREPIAGMVPPEIAEVPITTTWPTIGAFEAGRWVGRLADVRLGIGKFFTLGKLWAAATIPVSLAVFAWQLMPYVCRRYTLTNRRVLIRRGWSGVDEKWIALDEFDAIGIEILPGQEWLRAGELIFLRDGKEVLRFSGVSRPDVFRQVCQRACGSLLSVRRVREKQLVS